jgi:hypothetical protein
MCAAQVVPVTTFERNGRWIKSGHYVIDHNGDATVVHCGNMCDGSVSVQFMYKELTSNILPRGVIESMLLGAVVISEEQQAAAIEGRRLSNFFSLTVGHPPTAVLACSSEPERGPWKAIPAIAARKQPNDNANNRHND